MKRLMWSCISISIIMILALPAFALTAEDIINKRDNNEYIETARIKSRMIIQSGSRTIEKEMTIYADGENVLMEFTNPRDRGTKFLKRGDDLWMFFPEAEDLVKISGHMLKQGMMGSDFSYQDMMESNKLTDLYDFELIGEEELNGRKCYMLEGTAIEGKEVSYYRRKAWVDKERFVGLKEELYAKSGRLLKLMKAEEIDQIEDRYYPVRTVMEDKLRQNTSTEVIIQSMELNPEIDSKMFTIENLQQ